MRAPRKISLDSVLVGRGIVPTRDRARALVLAGRVIVENHRIDKPGTLVCADAAIRIKGRTSAYVSRGGEKLAAPLAAFAVPVTGKPVLDVGASTGGFCDCLLQHGAARVFAVDVGYGQLAWKLQRDPRVVRMDRTNIMQVTPADVQPAPELAVIDASFTSLQRLLPHVTTLLAPGGHILALVKPQFEVGRAGLEHGGVVRDLRSYRDVMRRLMRHARTAGLSVVGIMESPLQGPKGNREFFLYLRQAGPAEPC